MHEQRTSDISQGKLYVSSNRTNDNNNCLCTETVHCYAKIHRSVTTRNLHNVTFRYVTLSLAVTFNAL